MALNVFDTRALVRVVRERETEPNLNFFQRRYFNGEPIFSASETIFFDVIDTAHRLAPYVSPMVQGKLMEHRGYATRFFRPAYLKPKHKIDPTQHLNQRMPGEDINGSADMNTRRARLVREAVRDEDDSITTRIELQCMEILRLGQVTITGEGYGTHVLAYGRDATLTKALTGSNTWDTSGIKPLANLEAWALAAFNLSGSKLRDVFCGTDAITALKARLTTDEKRELLDYRRSGSSMMELGPTLPEYVKYEGTLGDFNFFSVSQKYQDEEANLVDLLPPKEVAMVSPTALEGLIAYGAILDPRANYAAIARFPKNWTSEDPAGEFTMTQSAPLAVALRPNASLGAQVIE